MLYVLPPLPVKNRYTEDWIRVWERELKKQDVEFEIIGKTKPQKSTYYFTNLEKAVCYECEQIKKLIKKKPKKVLCLDVDFPGLLVSVVPIFQILNPKVKFYGYLHAGSWNNGDIFKGTRKKLLERAIFDCFEKVFVATDYHKQKIREYFGESFSNIEVVGFPFYKEDVLKYVKPISFSEKKGILVVGRKEQSNYSIVKLLRNRFKDVRILQTKKRKEYYKELNKSKIILSLKTEETFGLIPLEGYVLGSIPLCPNRFSYPEVIGNEELLYNNLVDLVKKLTKLLTLKQNCFKIEIDKYRIAIHKIIDQL